MTEDSVEVKVIEKAYKKLALDALVIQQGRLQENKAQVGKEDLLQMVRYGAEKIFSGASAEYTAADIDTILALGEAETQQLSAKMNILKEEALKFTMAGDKSLYEFETAAPSLLAEDGGGDVTNLRKEAAAHWVGEPGGRRDKKRANLNENEYFRERMGGAAPKASRPTGPKLPPLQKLHDFQFFNSARIMEIQEKEEARAKWVWGRENAAKEAGVELSALQPDADEPPEAEEVELEEKAALLQQGFGGWQKRDFTAFTKAAEVHGRHDLTSIAAKVEGKTAEEVAAYSAVFWARCGELADGERIVKAIEKGEKRLQDQRNTVLAISRKLEQYTNPARELRINYGSNSKKTYTEEEDRFLLCAISEVGYGNWEDLKAAVRKHWLFRFDWYFKSRTATELGNRVGVLVRLIQKELGEKEDVDALRAGRPPPPKQEKRKAEKAPPAAGKKAKTKGAA